ncbi:MAG: methyltransferase domain-containing protein [Desulfarculus sp.]|nr:methyltransferase domain-containing protein [Desulfarculus sp.]
MSEPGGAKPDVRALLREVEEAVRQKKAMGLYDPAEIRRVEEAALSFSQAVEDSAAAELGILRAGLNQLWDTKQWGVSTHREGAAARLVLLLKKLIYKLTKFPLSVWLARQVAFNDQLIKALNHLIPQHVDLLRRQAHSDRRLDAQEDLSRALSERLRRQEEALREMTARLEALERASAQGSTQTELLLAQLQAIVEKQAEAGVVSAGAVAEIKAARSASRGASYLAFEDLHRGSRDEIKAKQAVYLAHFKDAASQEAPVLDLGCGRGEFLEAAKEAGIPARGVDINPEMAALGRQHGLEVAAGDGLEHLRALAPESLGGILMSQVIEHLSLDELTELVGLCASRLKPGGVLIAETVNPQCLSTFAGAFYLDLTHNKPIHPEAARFLWRWAGLTEVEIIYLSPVPPEHRLQPLTSGGPELSDVFNRNVERLNNLLYSHLDYAVKGRK